MRLISIIIPSLNSPIIDPVVRAALQQRGDHTVEVLVIGRDEPGRMPQLPDVRFIDTGRPISPAAARNRGIALARGELICFLDADCLPQPGWLDRLVTAYESGRPIVGGGVELVASGYWSLCDDLLSFGAALSSTSPGPRKELPSLNLCIERRLLERYGGFDEGFPRPAGEDTELCLRLQAAGYTLHCEPQASVIHQHNRRDLRTMLRHLHGYGAAQALLAQRHPARAATRGRQLAMRAPLLLLLAAPLLATIDILRAFLRGSPPRRYWFAAPGMIAAKSAWYVGLARALRLPSAAQPLARSL
jgi:GT2 family glycosyltransferase